MSKWKRKAAHWLPRAIALTGLVAALGAGKKW